MDAEQQQLTNRLCEAELSLNRFFEVKADKSPAEGKGYCYYLRTPIQMDAAGIKRWGIMGGNNLSSNRHRQNDDV